MKLFSLVGVEDQACSVSDVECEEQLGKLKVDMVKAYSYSQGVFSVTGVWCVCVCVCVCVCALLLWDEFRLKFLNFL